MKLPSKIWMTLLLGMFPKAPPTASRFVDAYLVLVDRLTENPFQFPNALGDFYKARFSKPFPFNNYFIVVSDTVFVIAIFHDKRDAVEWQGQV